MTKKDFFIIIIKLFGLYMFITTLFSIVPSMLSVSQIGYDVYTILYMFAFIAFFIFLLIYLLYHSEKVVAFLKLDKGFDTDVIQIEKLDKVQLVQVGLIIVGGLIFLQHLPDLLSNCFYVLKSMSQRSIDVDQLDFRTTDNYVYIAKDFISVLLGYLVLTNHEMIAKKLFK